MLHTELSSPHETEAGVSSATDTEVLLDQIRHSPDSGLYEDWTPETIAYRRALREQGDSATAAIIDQIHSLATSAADKAELAGYFLFSATPSERMPIGELLASPDVADEVLVALEYVGASDNLPQIELYVKDIQAALEASTPQERPMIAARVYAVLRATMAIAQRTPEGEDREAALRLHRKAAQLGAEYTDNDTLELYTKEEYFVFDTQPKLIADRYEALFEDAPYDNDFDRDDTVRADWTPEQQAYRAEQAESRVDVVRNLYGIGLVPMLDRQPDSDQQRHILDRLEYLEQGGGYFPTIGIEVEVTEESIMPPGSTTWNEQQKKAYLDEKQQLYSETDKAGVPAADEVVLWEFAHKPSRHYATQTREVQALMRLGLIHPTGESPVHMTMSDIVADGPKGRESIMLLRLLEATGWSTTGDRILEPSQSIEDVSWFYHNAYEGVRTRGKEKLSLGADAATEMRTFVLRSLSGLHRTLHAAYTLGGALKAYQKEDDLRNDTEHHLAAVWSTISGQAQALFEQYELPNPVTTEWNIDRVSDTEATQDECWKRFAELLDQAEQAPGSTGGAFVDAAQNMILQGQRAVQAAIAQEA